MINNIQDNFLEQAKQNNQQITIHLMAKTRLIGWVKNYDRHSITIEFQGQEQIIYKQAIAAIVVPQIRRRPGGGFRRPDRPNTPDAPGGAERRPYNSRPPQDGRPFVPREGRPPFSRDNRDTRDTRDTRDRNDGNTFPPRFPKKPNE